MKNQVKVLIGMATLSSLIFACSSKSETDKPVYRALTEAVYASGNLYPEQEYKVYSLSDGVMLNQLVHEGDSVQPGDVLFLIDKEVDQSRMAAASQALQLARENASSQSTLIQELENNLATLEEKYKNDSLNFIRYKNLWAKKAIAQKAYEQAELAYLASKNDLAGLRQRLSRTRDQVKLDLANAQSNYAATAKSLSDHAPSSSIQGKLYEVYKEPGELVRRGEPLALLGSGTKMFVKLNVDELDITRVNIGQEVVIRFDIEQNKVYKARISKIYPKLNKADQSFRVDAEFTGEAPQSLYGLTLEANIIIAKKDKVLTIPRRYVFGGDSVMIKKDGEANAIRIETGLQDWDYVEVKSGLDENTELIVR
ncbi:MAG: HlyD family efflux transporter periplasmic adaptor subunit [Bacteroidetes bacterium]|nr:MAG: HlyD family efflux transporter periplasmic adaptor subunit [Bacteroidota bacterium]